MELGDIIADHIEREPECLATARGTLTRWMEQGSLPPLRACAWLDILDAAQRGGQGFRDLLSLLRDHSEAARRLKDYAPFAGILTREERRRAFLSCTYDH